MEQAPKHSVGLKKRQVRLLQSWSDSLIHQARHPRKVDRRGGAQLQCPQAGHHVGRRSQGPVAEAPITSAAPAILDGEHGLGKKTEEGIFVPTLAIEKEPSLKDILLAINN